MTNTNEMNKTLNLDELKALRKELSGTIHIIREEAFKAFEEKEIDQSQFQDAKDYWQELQIKESLLMGIIMSSELDFLLDTNINSPMSKIIQATQKLKKAARKIEDFQEFLKTVADVIEVFGVVVKAIQSGGIAPIIM